jgi:hypothetical protein
MNLEIRRLLIFIVTITIVGFTIKPIPLSAAPHNFDRAKWYGYFYNKFDSRGTGLTNRITVFQIKANL